MSVWSTAVVAAGAVAIGVTSLVGDLRGYDQWPRKEAHVVRHDSGFGWTVPVYRAACYDGLDEVHGAKLTLLDGGPPAPGQAVTVACSPPERGLAALTASDHQALLRRDGVFIFTGLLVGAVAVWKRRRNAGLAARRSR